MAPTEGRLAKPEQRWECRSGTPMYYHVRDHCMQHQRPTQAKSAKQTTTNLVKSSSYVVGFSAFIEVAENLISPCFDLE